MTEYRGEVIRLYRKGLQAREIAAELNRSVQAIRSTLHQCRKDGLLIVSREEQRLRRSIGQAKAKAAFLQRYQRQK